MESPFHRASAERRSRRHRQEYPGRYAAVPPGDVVAPNYRVDTALAVLSDQEGFIFNASSLATACRAAQVHTTFDVDTSVVFQAMLHC